MFDRFSLPDIARVSRRTMFGALAVGAAGFVLALVLDAPLVGLGLCVGIGLGIFNFRLVQSSVAKIGRRQAANNRRPLAMNTLSRLAFISVIALGSLFISFDLGFGLLGGLAVFQMLLLMNVVRSMLKSGAATGGILPGSVVPGALDAGVLDADAVDADVLDAEVFDADAAEPVEVPDDRRAGD